MFSLLLSNQNINIWTNICCMYLQYHLTQSHRSTFGLKSCCTLYTQSKFETISTTATIENHTIKKAIFVCNRHSHRSIYMHKLNEWKRMNVVSKKVEENTFCILQNKTKNTQTHIHFHTYTQNTQQTLK